jgi:hemerythrin-like metal-binding protein
MKDRGGSATMAQLITGSDRFSVGIPRIDAQHQRLVELINELHAAMAEGAGRSAVGKTVDGLVDYTVTHFTAEEGLLKGAAYPNLEQHKAEHAKLLQQVRLLKEKTRAANIALTLEVSGFLQHWLIDHILSVDKRYTAHFHAAGVR